MNEFLKTISIAVTTIILGIVASLVYVVSLGKYNLFSKAPRSPKRTIPITYTIGWWTNQSALSVTSLQIELVESKLNLFNTKSLIAYTVSGELTNQTHWKAKITKVHISERINYNTSLDYDCIIEITPIVTGKENKTVQAGATSFEFKNEHQITSIQWGINRIKFVCGPIEQRIELNQKK